MLKNKFILSLSIFCLSLFILRIWRPECLCTDEAEQFLLAENFKWGYPIAQPPLFTWILICLSKLFGNNVFSISLIRYFCVFIFFYLGYQTSKLLFEANKSKLAAFSLFSLAIASVNLSRYFTHLNLLAASSMFFCFSYFKLIKTPSKLNYFFLGLAIGIGFLSKYNFIWLFIVVLIASLIYKESRNKFFDHKIFISVSTASLIIAPHYLWLSQNWSGFHYAMQRGEALSKDFFLNLPNNLIDIYSSILINFFLIWIIYNSKNQKPNYLLRTIGILAFVLPVVTLSIFKLGYFSPRWLIGIFPIFVLSLFDYIEINPTRMKQQIFCITSLVLPCIIVLEHALGLWFPDILNNNPKTNRPYLKIQNQIINKCHEIGKEAKDCRVFVYESPQLLANLKILGSLSRISEQAPYSSLKSNNSAYQNESEIVVWNPDESHKNPEIKSQIYLLEDYYTNSKTQKFKIKLSIVRHKAKIPLESAAANQSKHKS